VLDLQPKIDFFFVKSMLFPEEINVTHLIQYHIFPIAFLAPYLTSNLISVMFEKALL
jgi:hypothetical protein